MRVHYFRDFIPVATRLRNAIDCRMHHLIAIAFNFKLLSRTRTRFNHQPCNVLEELAPMVVNAALIAIGETFPRSHRCRSSALTIGKTFAHFIVGTKSLLTHVLTLSWENFPHTCSSSCERSSAVVSACRPVGEIRMQAADRWLRMRMHVERTLAPLHRTDLLARTSCTNLAHETLRMSSTRTQPSCVKFL